MLQPSSMLVGANGASVQEERAAPMAANTELDVAAARYARQDTMLESQVWLGPQLTVIGQPQRTTRRGAMDAFVNTCQRWKLSHQETLILLGYGDNPFLGRQILDSRMLATPQDARDRAAYVLAISVGLGTLFNETADAERKWLGLSHTKLNGKAPLAFMLEGRMANIFVVLQLVERERNLD
jgi:hypothetical protein